MTKEETFTHFMYCPFTGLGLHDGFRGNAWLDARIKVFNRFVLPSLVNQTDKNFLLWVSWRPEEKTNPLVIAFEKTLSSIYGLKFIFTYGGLCFWDDKYPDPIAYYQLHRNLSRTLPELVPFLKDKDYAYMTIQPSDDMYVSDFNEGIRDAWPEGYEAMGFKKGYIINYATKEIAEYNPTTNPPFFTIKFPKETFLNPVEHMSFTGPYKSHEYIVDKLKMGHWEERGFVVGTHGENISTTFIHPYKGATLSKDEQETVLIRTGNLFTEPIVVRKGARLWARQILNLLPFQDSIRNFYHSLPASIKRL